MVQEETRERLAFYRPASLSGVELMAAYESSRRWHVYHERYAFGVSCKAASGVRYRGREETIYDGTVVIREPGELLSNTFVGKPAEFKMLFVEPSVVADAARDARLPGTVHFTRSAIKDDPCLYKALYRLCRSIEANGSEIEQQVLFTVAFAELIRHAEHRPSVPELQNGKVAIQRAKAFLSEHCSEPLPLSQVARISGLSRFGLVHAFSREVGLSPHAYQVHVRVERARDLLKHGVSPAVAAATLGFSDQSHLTRHFKRIMHVTPSHYAKTTP